MRSAHQNFRSVRTKQKHRAEAILNKSSRYRIPLTVHRPLAGVEDDYESIEALRLRLLQARATWAKVDIGAGKTVDDESFLDGLKTGKYD
ncbi:hypothetical protein D3C84_526850 [compost metagenome]